jgi:hypothetical protein
MRVFPWLLKQLLASERGFYSTELVSHACYTFQDFLGMHYATSQKVRGSIPAEVIGFSIVLILLATLWPWGRLGL